MIEASRLSKFYGSFAAIRDVSFTVPQGQVAAFLGPNGAGKSTTMKILTGYLSPTAGTARVAGLDVARDRIRAAERLGLPARERAALSRYDAARPAALLRPRARAHRRAPGRAHRRSGGALRARIGDREEHPQALEGLPPARGHGAGAAARAGRAHHGRAHERPRPQPDPRSAPHHPRAGPEQDDSALHAHPAGGGGDGRPGHPHRARPRGFRRHAGRNAGQRTPRSTKRSAFLRRNRHAPSPRDPRHFRPRDLRLLQHAHGVRLHLALRLPERAGGLLAGALLRHQPRQPRPAQPRVPLPAGLLHPRRRHEPVGGGAQAGHRGTAAHAARHRFPGGLRQVPRRAWPSTPSRWSSR